MARVIDKDYLLTHKRKVRFFGIGPDDESWGYAVPVEVIENAPTLTPPNEWVNAKDNPPQLTGKYICCVEDTHGYMWSIPADYLLEMKTWVGEFGEIKNKVVYWMPLPAPPDRRPPEGEGNA